VANSLAIALILTANDRASRVIGHAFARAERQANALERSGRAFSDVGNKALIAGAAVSASFLTPLKYAADMEKMQVALTTALKGNTVEANKAFDTINKFAAQTPYALEEVMSGFIKLKNMGLDPSTEALTAYGNTASAMGKSLNDMVEAVADAATGEFERLKEFGIKASTQGRYVTFTFQGVKTTVRKEAAQIEAYLKTVGNVNFAGGIEKQSKTIYGQWSTVKDNARLVAASLGTFLIPAVNELFATVGPLLMRLQGWVEANPVLAKNIMLLVTSVGIGLVTFGATMKGLGFIMSGMGTAIKVAGYTVRGFGAAIRVGSNIAVFAVKGFEALRFGLFALQYTMTFTVLPALRTAGVAFMQFGATLLANPITWYVAAALALGVAVFFIIKNWDKISAFFSRIWQNVKGVFSRFWSWAKSYFLNFTPLGLIIKYWTPITRMFAAIWTGVKNVFTSAWQWIVNLNAKFIEAGKNIVLAIAKGIWSVATAPVKGIEWIVKRIREHLPFSPAKTGPLKDIHRIRLVETIAHSIKAKPLLNAFGNVTGQLYGQMNQPLLARAGGGTVQIHFNPVINLSGGATTQDAAMIVDKLKADFKKLMQQYINNKERVSF